MNTKNFFKFLEGKGEPIPLRLKIGFFPEELTPEELSVTGDLDLSYLPIKTLPEGLSVDGDLDLFYCTSLVSLPEGLTVGGTLDLYGCESLVSLPKGLKIEENLHIGKKLLDKYGGEDGVRKFIEDNGGYVKGILVW